jgi:NADH-quinone oxidoreductase subunit E
MEKKMTVDISKVDSIVEKHGLEARGLIHSLLDIQKEYYYLPRQALERVSERLDIPMMQVYQVASFYKAFSLEPRGKHLITVCLGTACHVRGGVRVIDHIQRFLNIEPGGTTKDMLFTLEAVNCLGCCALGPVMVLDGKYHGMMAASKVERVLKKYMNGGEDGHDA